VLVTVLVIGYAAALLAARRAHYDVRYATLLSAVVWGCYLSISSDILSLVGLVKRTNLVIAWICLFSLLRSAR